MLTYKLLLLLIYFSLTSGRQNTNFPYGFTYISCNIGWENLMLLFKSRELAGRTGQCVNRALMSAYKFSFRVS